MVQKQSHVMQAQAMKRRGCFSDHKPRNWISSRAEEQLQAAPPWLAYLGRSFEQVEGNREDGIVRSIVINKNKMPRRKISGASVVFRGMPRPEQ